MSLVIFYRVPVESVYSINFIFGSGEGIAYPPGEVSVFFLCIKFQAIASSQSGEDGCFGKFIQEDVCTIFIIGNILYFLVINLNGCFNLVIQEISEIPKCQLVNIEWLQVVAAGHPYISWIPGSAV